jgi:hypothetical protein
MAAEQSLAKTDETLSKQILDVSLPDGGLFSIHM